jgi:hypothetical protein
VRDDAAGVAGADGRRAGEGAGEDRVVAHDEPSSGDREQWQHQRVVPGTIVRKQTEAGMAAGHRDQATHRARSRGGGRQPWRGEAGEREANGERGERQPRAQWRVAQSALEVQREHEQKAAVGNRLGASGRRKPLRDPREDQNHRG